jgi:hypothetical protein
MWAIRQPEAQIFDDMKPRKFLYGTIIARFLQQAQAGISAVPLQCSVALQHPCFALFRDTTISQHVEMVREASQLFEIGYSSFDYLLDASIISLRRPKLNEHSLDLQEVVQAELNAFPSDATSFPPTKGHVHSNCWTSTVDSY